MTRTPDLDALCELLGVIWRYRDGAGQWREAPVESRRAVLAAMGHSAPDERSAADHLASLRARAARRAVPPVLVAAPDARPRLPADWQLRCADGQSFDGRAGTALPRLSPGLHALRCGAQDGWLLAAPPSLPGVAPGWGVMVPLYGLWQGDAPQGIGSYADLAAVARGLGGLGADFVGINPVHAGFPGAPADFSPYAPSHRARLNILHLPEAGAAAGNGPLIDYGAGAKARRAALNAAHAACPDRDAFEAWHQAETAEGQGLHLFSLHQALSDRFGPYWTDWPAPYRAANSPAVAAFAAENRDALRFHAWAQWRAHVALGDAAQAARAAGMAHGLYLDLAVGAHPRGAETWATPEIFAQGISLGAPPDAFAPEGQTWGLAPLRPDALLSRGMAPLAAILRAQFRHAGMLRVDHILGFERAFWVPDGLPGLYVRMPKAEMLATLRLEAARAGAVVVGEDLGNTPETLRDEMRAAGILGCRAVMFERDWHGDGAFLAPERHDAAALASFGTHDLPTWLGWRAGNDIAWRLRTGDMAKQAAAQAGAARRADVAAFDTLTQDADGGVDAMHGLLARSAARLVAVQAEDVLGCTEQPNLPGTIHSHPNWRRRLPVSAQGLARDARMRKTARIMADAGRGNLEHRSFE